MGAGARGKEEWKEEEEEEIRRGLLAFNGRGFTFTLVKKKRKVGLIFPHLFPLVRCCSA